ncbi:MAG TPA: thioesterase family protein [Flavitalea sp.]|nr:thioesterase family protein [Flavitalea sp.]
MPRIKLDLPGNFSYSIVIPLRITDLNYGGHVGNDSFLSLLHEARIQFLRHHGYSEMDIDGYGMIMSDVVIEFRQELFYGDSIQVWVTASGFTNISFDIFYKIEKTSGEKSTIAAQAKTGMVCFDYNKKKVSAIPDSVRNILSHL